MKMRVNQMVILIPQKQKTSDKTKVSVLRPKVHAKLNEKVTQK